LDAGLRSDFFLEKLRYSQKTGYANLVAHLQNPVWPYPSYTLELNRITHQWNNKRFKGGWVCRKTFTAAPLNVLLLSFQAYYKGPLMLHRPFPIT
jgi:hypothetical protein